MNSPDELRLLLLTLLDSKEETDLRELIFADLVFRSGALPERDKLALIGSAAVAFMPTWIDKSIGQLAMGEYAKQRFVARECDILIVAIKPVELYAVQLVFGISPDSEATYEENGIPFWEGQIAGARGQHLKVTVTLSAEDSNVVMANFLSAVLRVYASPKLAMLVGMAAGVQGEVALGDVLIVTGVTDYLHGRATEEGFKPRPRTAPFQIAQRRRLSRFDPARSFRLRDKWKVFVDSLPEYFQGLLPADYLTEARIPAVKKGLIASGDHIVEDGTLKAWHDRYDEQVKGGEMEGFGFALVCDELSIPWMILRGIADYGEPGRSKSWQFASSAAAATAGRIYAEEFSVE